MGQVSTNLPGEQAPKIQEDMIELVREFKIPKLKYIDVPKQERLAQIMVRWPLLEELSKANYD